MGRQFANFIAETVHTKTGADVQSVSYMAQVQEDGVTRSAHVNLGGTMIEYEFFAPLFGEGSAEKAMHGVLSESGDTFKLHLRVNSAESNQAVLDEEHEFSQSQIFDELTRLSEALAGQADATLKGSTPLDFGTDSSRAFLDFLDGYDGFQYIQRTEGAVAKEFLPSACMDSLLRSIEEDPSFDGPFDTAIQLARACVHYRLGNFEDLEAALTKVSEARPDNFRPLAALGEIFYTVGNAPRSADFYEKALAVNLKQGDKVGEIEIQERAALYSRLGLTQLTLGMPVNAERNFRKAIDLETTDRPSVDLLASVLTQTNRAHELPALWQEEVDKNPQNAAARAKYAGSLFQIGREEDGILAFENALSEVDDKTFVKRYFAPILTQRGEVDRAMDFYEDCLEVAPNDFVLLLEYANTLKAGDREFEVPPVLKNVLASNPDPDTRAQTLAWLIELEQPKRAEVVEESRIKMENGDFDGAIRDLKPLRNWLADYWKLWALLSSAYNRLDMAEEAEEAAQRLLNLFPGYEPAYGELVNALAHLGKNEEAYAVMRYAATNIPSSLGVHVNLALAAKRAGHDDEARSLARQIREAIGPNDELEPVLAEIEA